MKLRLDAEKRFRARVMRNVFPPFPPFLAPALLRLYCDGLGSCVSRLHQLIRPSFPYRVSSQLFAFLKCPLPKKPRDALRGDGCCAVRDQKERQDRRHKPDRRNASEVSSVISRYTQTNGRNGENSSTTYNTLQNKVFFLLLEMPSGIAQVR